jgi:hypothetical protein
LCGQPIAFGGLGHVLNTECKKKVSKLLPLLASDKPGEVVNAASALVRTLNHYGSSVHDLVFDLNNPKIVQKTVPTIDRTLVSQVTKIKDMYFEVFKENAKLKKELQTANEAGRGVTKFTVFLLLVIAFMYLTR